LKLFIVRRGRKSSLKKRQTRDDKRKVFDSKNRRQSEQLQPIQVEISMLGTDPNIPVEIKYLSLGLKTCPNLRCHNKKGGVEGTHQTQQKSQNTEINEVSPKKRACQLYGPSQSPYSIGPLA